MSHLQTCADLAKMKVVNQRTIRNESMVHTLGAAAAKLTNGETNGNKN